jgi:hypothetical protein
MDQRRNAHGWEHLAWRQYNDWVWQDCIVQTSLIALLGSHSFPVFFVFRTSIDFRLLYVFQVFYRFTKTLDIENLFRDQTRWTKAKVVNTSITPLKLSSNTRHLKWKMSCS